MEIDNRNQVKNLLKFGEDTYYYLQIIQRKKENPDLPKQEIKRWRLFITSLKTLTECDPYIEFICKNFNARAYISILPRSLENFALKNLISFAEVIKNKSYSQCFRTSDKIALDSETIKWKGVIPRSRLLLDFDGPSLDRTETKRYLTEKGFVIEDIIPTKNGFHVICENCNPSRLLGVTMGKDLIVKDDKVEFTLIRTCNTVYFASMP